ncbi:MAG: molybdopterin-dependent oxidoreductase [Pseudomonadota bacterium]
MHRPISLTHWGAFAATVEAGRFVAAEPLEGSGADPDMIKALPRRTYATTRIASPHVRAGFLRHGHRAGGDGRGRERMVPVPWETALHLAAGEIARIRDAHGPTALFAGSYGWSSAGRFHHARTQVRRFFGACGGFTDQTTNYSWGAAQVILPYVLGGHEAVSSAATSWRSIAGNTDVLVAFGGLNPKNWNVTSGGSLTHDMARHVEAAVANGMRLIVMSPDASDIPPGVDATHMAPMPGTDTAIMLALAREMVVRGRVDRAFLDRYTEGAERFLASLEGAEDGVAKTLDWAAAVADVPVASLVALSDAIERGRVMLTASWSLQRAVHGEQTYWALVALAAILGQIGLPGGGFTFGYGSMNGVGEDSRKGYIPTLATLGNRAGTAIPVARIADMLEAPGSTIPFNGQMVTLPDTQLIYWAGGNPFHHAQDLFRLERLWARPQTVIVNETHWTPTAQRADIVFPATTSVERNDIGGTSRDPHVVFMPKLIGAVGGARDDHDIFADLAERLGCEDAFTEGRSEMDWLRHLWGQTEARAARDGITAPTFDDLRQMNLWAVPLPETQEVYLAPFRNDPEGAPLKTPSGRIELSSSTLDDLQDPDIFASPTFVPPPKADNGELHLLTPQPAKYLHSQLAETLGGDRPTTLTLHPDEAAARGLEDGATVVVSSPTGQCLATLNISEGCRQGVALMQTGAWYAPRDGVERNGNPNAVTVDRAASPLSQASAAQTCLVTLSLPEG